MTGHKLQYMYIINQYRLSFIVSCGCRESPVCLTVRQSISSTLLFQTNLCVIAGFANVVNTSNLLLADPAVVNLEDVHFLLLVQPVFVHSNNCLCTSAITFLQLLKHRVIQDDIIVVVIITITVIRVMSFLSYLAHHHCHLLHLKPSDIFVLIP